MLFSSLAAVVQMVGTSVSCLNIVTISEYVVLFAISVMGTGDRNQSDRQNQ